jgi:arylsulfatase A-like enzyme
VRILYLDLDTLNPTHLGCYGYHRNTSPTIDALAAAGVRCTNTYCSDAPCLPSRAAFYSGRFGIQSGIVGHGGTAADPKLEGQSRGFRDVFDRTALVPQLQRSGFHTALISPFGQRHGAHWFYAGFNEMHNTGGGGMESAEEVTPTVARWLAQHAQRDNWYLHINYWDPHTPYRAPLDYGEPFADEPLPAWLTPEVLARHQGMTGPHGALEIMMYHDQESPRYPRHPGRLTDMAQLRRMIDGYDTGIRYTDDQVKFIIDQLDAAGVLDDTAIIISADHGENQGELGIYGEHATADHATCHIPMIVRWPGGAQGVVDEGFHYNLDWAPTLAELLGKPAQPLWDGQSYAATVRDGTPDGRDELVISQCCHVCQRSVRFGPWLYMRTYHDGFHLFAQEMLYNLDEDPHEQHDLAPSCPELCREGAWRLLRWHDAQMQRLSPDAVDPLWTVIAEGGPLHAQHDSPHSPLPAYLQHLEATGRAEGATLLRAKYGRWLK